MLFATNAASLVQLLLVVDSNNDPIAGIAFDDVDLAVSYKLQDGAAWVTPALVAGTLGAYLANSWVELGDGLYQWCPPAAAIVAGTSTAVRVVYAANPAMYDTIEPKLASQSVILAAVAGVTNALAAAVARLQLEVQITGFPNVICRNADYRTETESEIRLTLEDLTGTAITDIAGTPVAELGWLFGMGSERDPAIIAGAVTWDAGTGELVVQWLATATASQPLGAITWQIGVSITDEEDPPNTFTRWLGGGTTRLIERQF